MNGMLIEYAFQLNKTNSTKSAPLLSKKSSVDSAYEKFANSQDLDDLDFF